MQGEKALIFKVVFLKSLLPCFEFPRAVALLLLAQLILGSFPWQLVALMVQKMETLYNRAPEFTEVFTGRLIDIYDFTVSCLSIKPDLLPTHKTEIKCLVASEIVSSIHTWQVTWVRLLIMIWRMYCGSTFKLAEWLINLEVKKITIISCATRGEKVHWWRPAGLVTVPGVILPSLRCCRSSLACVCLAQRLRHGHDPRCHARCCWGRGGLALHWATSYFICPAAKAMLGRGERGSGCWGKWSERFAVCG